MLNVEKLVKGDADEKVWRDAAVDAARQGFLWIDHKKYDPTIVNESYNKSGWVNINI